MADMLDRTIREYKEYIENKKSPIGITPRYIWEEKRIHEIAEAIDRFVDAGYTVPNEWLSEYQELLSRKYYPRGDKRG